MKKIMKKTNAFFGSVLLVLLLACFTACENPIISRWWDDPEPEFEYIPVLKNVPQISYRTIIEEKWLTIIEQLPPEVITEYIYITLPPEIVYEIVYEIKEVEVIVERIVEVEVIKEVIREIVIENTVYLNPTPEQIIEYIRENPEIILQVITENEVIREEVIKVIRELLTDEQIKEIIQNLPPEILLEYLTDVQIKYIVESMPPEMMIQYLTEEQVKYIIEQQPPHKILQSIKIINIEYIIFSGNSEEYNGPPGPGAATNLTSQERASNDRIIASMAEMLADNPGFLVILHGHANPVLFTPEELAELDQISRSRANAVKDVLEERFLVISGGIPIDSERRVSAVGYGGGNNISLPEGTYAGLNRRVEVILFEIQSMTM